MALLRPLLTALFFRSLPGHRGDARGHFPGGRGRQLGGDRHVGARRSFAFFDGHISGQFGGCGSALVVPLRSLGNARVLRGHVGRFWPHLSALGVRRNAFGNGFGPQSGRGLGRALSGHRLPDPRAPLVHGVQIAAQSSSSLVTGRSVGRARGSQ